MSGLKASDVSRQYLGHVGLQPIDVPSAGQTGHEQQQADDYSRRGDLNQDSAVHDEPSSNELRVSIFGPEFGLYRIGLGAGQSA